MCTANASYSMSVASGEPGDMIVCTATSEPNPRSVFNHNLPLIHIMACIYHAYAGIKIVITGTSCQLIIGCSEFNYWLRGRAAITILVTRAWLASNYRLRTRSVITLVVAQAGPHTNTSMASNKLVAVRRFDQ